MAEPVTIPAELDAALDQGLAKPGTAFHTYRPFQLALVIEFARMWKELSEGRRAEALRDPWVLKDVLFALLPPLASFMQREALLHLVHPDAFRLLYHNGALSRGR